MTDLLLVFLSSLLGLLIAGVVVGFFFLKKITKEICMAKNLKRISNWLLMFTKLDWRNYIETMLRAEEGKSIARPFGTPIRHFSWNKIQFNPVYLSKTPLDDVEVNTEIVLGPRAKQPLKLEIPILLAGMAYGSSLSLRSHQALGGAAKQVGSVLNFGNGVFLPEMRRETDKFVLQIPRAYWSREPEIWQQVDLIEIGLGHSAWASAPIRIDGYRVSPDFADRIKAIPGLDLEIHSNLPENTSFKELKQFVQDIKAASGGKPVGFKFGCSHYIERELEKMIEAGADVIFFDGNEGGTHGSPPLFQDHFGLPLLPGLCRAAKFMRDNQLCGKVSLVVGGGLSTPGDFLKCLALGADAVIVGTIAVLSMVSSQVTKTLPWEPPTEIVYHGAQKEDSFDYQLGGQHLSNYLESCLCEMKELTKILGKTRLTDLNKNDLVALDPIYAQIAEIECIY